MSLANTEAGRNHIYSNSRFRKQLSIEDAQGVTVVQTPGLVSTVFSGEAFLNNFLYLTEQGVRFVQRDLGRSDRAARALMEESMRLSNLIRSMSTEDILRDPRAKEKLANDPEKSLKIPSVILVRHEDVSPGQYFAISVQRVFPVLLDSPHQESKVVIPTMYHGLRAVDEEERRYRTPEEEGVYERLRVGRLMTDLALLTHRGVKRYVHRTASAIAVWANMNAKNLMQTYRHPWDRLFDQDPFEYKIVKEVARLLGAHGTEIEPTGVSRRVLLEPNKEPDIKNHPQVQRLHKKITASPPDGFGVDFANGDLGYGLWVVV